MSPSARILPAAVLALTLAAGAQAQSSCSSDGQPRPTALLERFINADCETCWSDPDTPRARVGELAIDWIVPGARGDDAALAAAARRDGLERLDALGRQRPLPLSAARTARAGRGQPLRVAHGLPFNGYIGASIDAGGAAPQPVTAWLALVETLPAGTEGSPVERNLVRNVLQVPWPAGVGPRTESRPMNIPAGSHPERLRVVGWLQDARGVIRAISESGCRPARPRR